MIMRVNSYYSQPQNIWVKAQSHSWKNGRPKSMHVNNYGCYCWRNYRPMSSRIFHYLSRDWRQRKPVKMIMRIHGSGSNSWSHGNPNFGSYVWNHGIPQHLNYRGFTNRSNFTMGFDVGSQSWNHWHSSCLNYFKIVSTSWKESRFKRMNTPRENQ